MLLLLLRKKSSSSFAGSSMCWNVDLSSRFLGTSIAVTVLKLLMSTLNAIPCVLSNKIDPIYIVCMKFHLSFSYYPPLFWPLPVHIKNFWKGASFSILNLKIKFSIHLSSGSWPPQKGWSWDRGWSWAKCPLPETRDFSWTNYTPR